MTIIEAISTVDNLVPNTYMLTDKIRWLSQLDAQITAEILDTHEPDPDTEVVPFVPYNENTDQDTVLVVPFPYDDIYVYFLEMQIGLFNRESEEYNKALALYNSAYTSFRNYWNKYHMPKTAHNRYF